MWGRKSVENYGKASQGFHSILSESIISSAQWMDQGVECEILKHVEKQWVKGRIKVRVIVEFCPDEEAKTLSELDAFRDEEA
jgi:KGK domain